MPLLLTYNSQTLDNRTRKLKHFYACNKKSLIPSSVMLIGLTILTTGCSTIVKIEPAPTESVTYNSGSSIITSAKDSSTVMLTAGDGALEKGKRVLFYTSIRNDSTENQEIQITDVSATSSMQGPLEVHSYESVEKEIKRKAMWAGVGAVFSAAAEGSNSANAGYSTTATTGTYNSQGTYGSAYTPYSSKGSYTAVSTTYDPAAKQAAQAAANERSAERISNIASQKASSMSQAEQLLRRTTLRPDESYEAAVLVDGPRSVPDSMSVVIRISDDVHKFEFDVSNP